MTRMEKSDMFVAPIHSESRIVETNIHLFLRGKPNEKNSLSKMKVCVDIASAIFILYFPYYGLWAHYTSTPSNPLPWQVILLIMDVFPCVFAIFWLLFRYLDVLNAKFPFLKTFMNSPLYKLIGLVVIAVLTILINIFWR